MLQLLEVVCREPVLHNKRSHHNKKSAHDNEEKTPLTANRESLPAATETKLTANRESLPAATKTKHNQKIK